MVLRKQPPPSLDYLAKGNGHSEQPSSASPTSPTAKSASSSSPKRLTRPRRTRSSPQPRQVPPQGQVYSPDLNTSPAFDLMPIEQAQRSPPGSSPNDSQNPWADDWVDVSRQGVGQSDMGCTSAVSTEPQDSSPDDKAGKRVPPIVVAGTQRRMAANERQQTPGSNDDSEWDKSDQEPAQFQSNNPFLKAGLSEHNPWGDIRDSGAASFLQSDGSDRLSQSEGFIPMTARLSLLDQQESESPWSGERSSTGLQHPDISKPQQPDCDQASRMSQNSAQVPMGIYLNDGQSYNHQGDQHVPAVIFEPPAPGGHPPRYGQQQLDPGKLGSGHETNTPSAPTSNATTESSHELIDVDPPAHEVADTKGVPDPQAAVQNAPPTTAPPLPERAAAVDPSAGITTEPRESKPLPAPHISEAEARRQKEQRSETYSIRHVNWTDISGKLRKSPVLVQNQNGPCPLLALVNALVLRASEDAQPPIVKALQNREQISLGLLIEALFDELTTRLGPDEELPDIEALSRFLTMLHTGMNVNPRLTLESDNAVGTFLQTSDIRLYGTFGVPLVHGWVADPSSPTHESLSRVAQYHEDVQLLHFRREELEERVFRGGAFGPEEEQVMKDIQTIQQFVDVDNATQLSAFGLDRLAQQLAPGSVSILFRNDHFSTLYKHPQLHQLFTMVSDAGYSGHAEVVWECLVDVSGSRAGFFSGDFRPVGNTPAESPGPAGPRSSSARAPNLDVPGEPLKTSMSPQEQSDADYAYALQLQYDEEQRNNQDRNRRASAPQTPRGHASGRNAAHYRSSSAVNDVPDRGGRGSGSTSDRRTLRPSHFGGATHSTNNNPEDGPPPPYEQAAHSPIYSPALDGPLFTDFSQEDRYLRNLHGQRPGPPASTLPDRPKDRNSKDCVVM